jgi:hypothetical protein
MIIIRRRFRRKPVARAEVSSPRELHPQALSEPDVNFSIHPAPIAHHSQPSTSERTSRDAADES